MPVIGFRVHPPSGMTSSHGLGVVTPVKTVFLTQATFTGWGWDSACLLGRGALVHARWLHPGLLGAFPATGLCCQEACAGPWPCGHALLCGSRLVPPSASSPGPGPRAAPGSHAGGEGKPKATAEHPGFLTPSLGRGPQQGVWRTCPRAPSQSVGAPRALPLVPEPPQGWVWAPALLMRGRAALDGPCLSLQPG